MTKGRRTADNPLRAASRGKGRLRDEGFLIYDLADVEAACSAGQAPARTYSSPEER